MTHSESFSGATGSRHVLCSHRHYSSMVQGGHWLRARLLPCQAARPSARLPAPCAWLHATWVALSATRGHGVLAAATAQLHASPCTSVTTVTWPDNAMDDSSEHPPLLQADVRVQAALAAALMCKRPSISASGLEECNTRQQSSMQQGIWSFACMAPESWSRLALACIQV